MKITKSLYDEILLHTPPVPPESGGILGGKDGIVNVYFADPGGICEYDFYAPDTYAMNKIIAEWAENGIDFMGMYHSHFPGGEYLSYGDVKYIKKIMSVMSENSILHFPVILPDKMVAYRAENVHDTVHIFCDDIKIIF